jgi:hypothetical protein
LGGRSLLALVLAGCAGPRLAGLAGVWESAGGFEYSRMDIAADGGIAWRSSGCLIEFEERASGTFREGKLILSAPVTQYSGGEARTFLLFREGGREYLVSETELQLVREEQQPFASGFWWGLRRRLPREELEERMAAAAEGGERAALLEEWAAWPIDERGVRLLARIAREDLSEEVRWEAVSALRSAAAEDGPVGEMAAAALGGIEPDRAR